MRYLVEVEEAEAIQWMNAAAESAKKALCLRALCGTVIIQDGKIIGSGYNAPPRDGIENRLCMVELESAGKPKYDRTCCMHAEWRAIMDGLAHNPEKMKNARLYFTRVDEYGNILKSGKPYCTVCSRLAFDSGIAEFVLWHEEGICVYDTEEYNKLSYEYKI